MTLMSILWSVQIGNLSKIWPATYFLVQVDGSPASLSFPVRGIGHWPLTRYTPVRGVLDWAIFWDRATSPDESGRVLGTAISGAPPFLLHRCNRDTWWSPVACRGEFPVETCAMMSSWNCCCCCWMVCCIDAVGPDYKLYYSCFPFHRFHHRSSECSGAFSNHCSLCESFLIFICVAIITAKGHLSTKALNCTLTLVLCTFFVAVASEGYKKTRTAAVCNLKWRNAKH